MPRAVAARTCHTARSHAVAHTQAGADMTSSPRAAARLKRIPASKIGGEAVDPEEGDAGDPPAASGAVAEGRGP